MKLSPEVISLVHHVELNKAGWLKKAMRRLIVAIIYLADGKLNSANISQNLQNDLQVRIEAGKLEMYLEELCESNTLIKLPSHEYKISDDWLAKLEIEFGEVDENEEKAKKIFCELIARNCPTIEADELWISFNDCFLTPMIRDLGANTYQLISSEEIDLPYRDSQKFLEPYSEDLKPLILNSISKYLNLSDTAVRSHILRILNAYFLTEACNLDNDTINKLSVIRKKNVEFRLLLDTNFLFSILELHENPSNEAAVLLKELVQQLSNTINIKLYITPITKQEAIRTITRTSSNLNGIKWNQKIVSAAMLSGNFDGLSLKFFQARMTNPALTPDDYFEPYTGNLLRIARENNVEIFQEDISDYSMNQSVINDITEQLDRQKNKASTDGKSPRGKNYEQLKHDMVLWNFVKDKRPSNIESPLEAKYWIVTIDYRFIGFDTSKRHKRATKTPICVHPTNLIQMLQFFVPRTPMFERALFSSMKLPFLFQNFDPESEKMAVRILKSLSRFEDVGDLSENVVADILTSQVLNQRLASTKSTRNDVEIITSEIAKQNKQLEAKIDKIENQKNTKIRNLEDEITNQQKTFEQEKNARTTKTDSLEEELEKHEKREFYEYRLVIPLLIVAIIEIIVWYVFPKFVLSYPTLRIILATIPFGLILGVFSAMGSRNRVIKKSKFYDWLRWFTYLYWGTIVLGLIVAVVGNIATKELLGITK